MASENFINECKNRANSNRLGQLIVDGLDSPITQSDKLQSLTIDSGCYVDGNIIGSVYIKKLTAQILDTNDIDFSDKTIYPQIGVKFADNSTEYINMGKFIIEHPNDAQTSNNSQITAYDDLNNKLEANYISNIDYSIGNITLKELYIDVCEQLGLIPIDTEFTNNNIPVSNNPFTNGEKNRTILETIAKISCSFVDIDVNDNTIGLCWLSQNEEPDYTFNLDDYTSLEGGKIVSGPVNCLIIKNSQIDSENVTIRDEESILTNGENSIILNEDYILHNAELRQEAITAIWNKVHNMTYVDSKLTTYYGKPFLKLGDKIRIYISETEYFDTYVLKHNFTYDGTFISVIESPAFTKQEINTKQNISLGEILKNVQIDVNKQSGEINQLVECQNEQQTQISQVTQSINNIQNLFQITGGVNLIKNSVGLFGENYWQKSEEGTFYFGEDTDLIGITSSSSKISISNGNLISDKTNINGLTIDNIKSFNFKIRQDEDVTTTVTLYGLSEDYPIYKRTFVGEIDWQDIYSEDECRFFVDSSDLTLKIETSSQYDGIFEISDLMLNDGEKQQWQPATGEIWGTIVKMSQQGISCYSIESGYITMMTTQGFQIRELYGSSIGDIISKFTNLGIETIDIIQSGKHTQKNLVHDMIESDGNDVYIEYIKE